MVSLWHLFLRDVYDPIWPNIAASLIVYFFVRAKINTIKKLHEAEAELNASRHEETKQHISDKLDEHHKAVKEIFGNPLTSGPE